MPFVGNDVTTVRGMTEVMEDLTQNTLPGFTRIAKRITTTQLNNANGQLDLQAISNIQNEFANTNRQLQQQREKYSSLPTPKTTIVASAYQQGRNKLDTIAQTVDGMNSAMQMVPELLGQNGARTYLLAVQTPSEQRSGGGLVGSLGTFHADHGTVSVGELHPDGTLLNGGNANAEEKAVFNGPLAFSFDLRDTFAIPDIARNAEMLNATWQRSPYACDVDGLLAVDPVFIQAMVGISGDVRLSDGTVLNGSNTAQYLLNTIYKSVPAEQQDAYFNYVAQTVLNNAFNNMSIEKLLRMGQTISTMAQERHLYAYTFHEDEADHFQGAGTAKSAPGNEANPQVGIYLNEQNSSKLGWYIDRKVTVTAAGRGKDGTRTYHVRYTLTNTQSVPNSSGDADSGSIANLHGDDADSDSEEHGPERRQVRRRMSAEHIRKTKKETPCQTGADCVADSVAGHRCRHRRVHVFGVEREKRAPAGCSGCERTTVRYRRREPVGIERSREGVLLARRQSVPTDIFSDVVGGHAPAICGW